MSADCPFCSYLRGSGDCVFVTRGRDVSVLVNPRQYERGALLVIPNRHVATLIEASDEEFVAVQIEARRMAKLLADHFGAEGINVYQNAGAMAGQTVSHYHVHVVPRYSNSDPGRRFHEKDYDVSRREELEKIAEALISARAAEMQNVLTSLEAAQRTQPRSLRVLYLAWLLLGAAAFVFAVTAGASDTSSTTAKLAFGLLVGGILVRTMGLRETRRRGAAIGYALSIAMFVAAILITM